MSLEQFELAHLLPQAEMTGPMLLPERLLERLTSGDLTRQGVLTKLFEVVTQKSFDSGAETTLLEVERYVQTLFAYEQYEMVQPALLKQLSDVYFDTDEWVSGDKARLARERKYIAFQLAEVIKSVGAEDFPELPTTPRSPSKVGAETKVFSLAVHLPAFAKALADCGFYPAAADTEHVLVGALSLETIDGFRALFPDSQLTSIDPQGVLTKAQAEKQGIEFRQTNILSDLPADLLGRYDSVIADGLFHDLVDPDGRNIGFDQDAIGVVLKNMRAFIKPDGVLVFTQNKRVGEFGGDEQACWMFFEQALAQTGFVLDKAVSRRNPEKVRFRHPLYEYLGSERGLDSLPIMVSSDVSLFVARPA